MQSGALSTELSETGVRAVDSTGAAMSIRATDWRPSDRGPSLPIPVDESVVGCATELRFSASSVRFERLYDAESHELVSGERREFPPDEYVVRADGDLFACLRFSGRGTLRIEHSGRVTLSFPDSTPVTIGFRSRRREPSQTVTVPRTVEGVATAISAMGASHRTATADRSLPAMRDYPPLVEFGEEVDLPWTTPRPAGTGDVRLTLPPDLAHLVPAAPLSYYLSADVDVESGASPELETPSQTRSLGGDADFEADVASLLRRSFLLDCVVRSAGPFGRELAEKQVLPRLGLSAEGLYDAPVAERLEAYLDAPFERVSDELPEWHLSMYVEATMANVPTLPHLLQNVPFVFLPRSTPLAGRDRLTRSLDDFYRGPNVPEVPLVEPDLGAGATHGWMADSIPIDVFKTVPEAYENRFDYTDRGGEPLSVVIVLNDPEMSAEYEDVTPIYRDREVEGDIEVTVRRRTTRTELADVFESEHDLVHYIGHCETGGLRCVDGTLAAAELTRSRVQAFFLNACGSFYEGLELVRKGSVAGAVTYDTVLDTPAAKVGTVFVRLLIAGFSIERALALARRRIIMGKDYAVVGDGTHTLTRPDERTPPEIHLEELDDGRFLVGYRVGSPRVMGGTYRPPGGYDRRPRLYGSNVEFTLDRERLVELLDRRDVPVIFDGDVHSSADIRRLLA